MRTLRLRKGGFLATFVAMFFGALIVMACGGLLETGIRTAVQPQRLAGAPIVVAGAQQLEIPKEDPAERDPEKDLKTETANLPEKVRLDASLVANLRAAPGVEQVVADISFPAGQAVCHGWSSTALTPYTLTSGKAPAQSEVVVESGTVGERIDLPMPGRVESFRISGIAVPQHTAGKPSVFFSDDEAARLSGHPGYVDFIGVFAPVTTDLSAALRGTSALALTGDDRGTIEFPEAVTSGEALIVLAAVSGGLSVMVAMFVVGSTLALSVQQRMRELALLRAIGTTPRQLRRMVLGEAMVVSVLATGIAGLLGSVLGRWLFDQLVENGVVPPVVEFHQGWIPVVAAVGVATLAAFFGALLAANRAARTRPTEALMEAGVQRHWLTPLRVILAVLCFGGGSALAIVTVAASTAGPSVMLWAIGLAMISPGVTKMLVSFVQWPLRALSGVSGRFAMLKARGRSVRIAAAVTPIMLATGIATANIYLQTTQAAVSDQAFTENLRADAVISAPAGLDPSLLEKVKTTPGVTGASEYVPSQVFILKPFGDTDDDGIPVLGVTAEGAAQTTAAVPSSGTLTALHGNTVAMPESLGHKVGDRLVVMLGDGAVTDVLVVAVFPARGFRKPAHARRDDRAAHHDRARAADLGARDRRLGTPGPAGRDRRWPRGAVRRAREGPRNRRVGQLPADRHDHGVHGDLGGQHAGDGHDAQTPRVRPATAHRRHLRPGAPHDGHGRCADRGGRRDTRHDRLRRSHRPVLPGCQRFGASDRPVVDLPDHRRDRGRARPVLDFGPGMGRHQRSPRRGGSGR